MSAETLYEQDYLGWLEQQKSLLANQAWEHLDREHLLEELEGMSRSEHRQLLNRLIVLLVHLLKWQCQPQRQSRSWSVTIITQRNDIRLLLRESPSLKHTLAEKLKQSYPKARMEAAEETGLLLSEFPQVNPFTLEQILDENFWPEQAHE